MVEALTAWILGLMVAMQPQAPWRSTYEATAHAIADAVAGAEPLFAGDRGRERTAALLVSLGWFESTFDPHALGDHGRAHGLFQVHGHGELADPDEAVGLALELVRTSMRACRNRPLEERLAWYAGGGYDCSAPSADALKKSRHRVLKAMWLAKHVPPP